MREFWGRAFILLPRAGWDAPCGCAGSSARAKATLGAPPLKPWQEPEVPAPPAFYSKPCCLSCSSARSARTLRVSSVRCGAGARATLGALPLRPCQGTEFPGPSAFYSKPCCPPCSSARSARTLRVSSVRCGAGARATLGAPPLRPCQGTEFPGPSTLGRSGVQLTALLPQRALIQQIRIKREHRAVLLRMGAQRQFHHLINQLRIR